MAFPFYSKEDLGSWEKKEVFKCAICGYTSTNLGEFSSEYGIEFVCSKCFEEYGNIDQYSLSYSELCEKCKKKLLNKARKYVK